VLFVSIINIPSKLSIWVLRHLSFFDFPLEYLEYILP
jgi:hypothetical protein